MKHEALLQKYLSNLAVLNVKFHNLHWNVVGGQFVQVHMFTEEIYDRFFSEFDDVAELLKMKGILPLSSLADYLANTSVEELKARDFTIVESLEIARNELTAMKELATEIRNTADEEGDFETVAMFEDFVSAYSKNIWFINSILK